MQDALLVYCRSSGAGTKQNSFSSFYGTLNSFFRNFLTFHYLEFGNGFMNFSFIIVNPLQNPCGMKDIYPDQLS